MVLLLLFPQVDFPLQGLDLSGFLAPSHEQHRARGSHSDGDDGSTDSGNVYDLYSAVHHLGAMGGGHYVATVRDDFDALQEKIVGNQHSSPEPSTKSGENKWMCYNDSVVSPATAKEVGGSSAYLLFYMRRDVASASVRDLHAHRGDGDGGEGHVGGDGDGVEDGEGGGVDGSVHDLHTKPEGDGHLGRRGSTAGSGFDVNGSDVQNLEGDTPQCQIS